MFDLEIYIFLHRLVQDLAASEPDAAKELQQMCSHVSCHLLNFNVLKINLTCAFLI